VISKRERRFVREAQALTGAHPTLDEALGLAPKCESRPPDLRANKSGVVVEIQPRPIRICRIFVNDVRKKRA
jgi:hypothetical protein